ncbi:unnamed protein product [Caenorhabditis nigoni]
MGRVNYILHPNIEDHGYLEVYPDTWHFAREQEAHSQDVQKLHEKGILIIAILDLISDLDRRAFYLEYKGKVPFPRGLRRVSKETLKRSSLQQLVLIWEHYDRIQDYLMALFMERTEVNV